MRRLRSAAVAALTAVAAAAGAASAQAAWLPGPTYGDGGLAGLVGIGADASGATTVAWLQRTGAFDDPSQVRVQRISSGGAAGTARTVGMAGGPVGSVPSSASVAVARSGAAVVAWVTPDGDAQLVALGADGAPGPIRTLAADVAPGTVRTGVDETGNATVAWIGDADAPSGPTLRVRRIAADGNAGAPVDLGEPADARPALAVAPGGQAYVAWRAEVPPATDAVVRVARLGAGGTLASGPATVSAPNRKTVAVTVSASASGAIVDWAETVEDDTTYGRTTRLRDSGGVVGVALRQLEMAGIGPGGAASTIADDGTVTTVWYQNTTLGAGELSARRVSADGTESIRTLMTTTSMTEVELLPAIASAPDGGAFLTTVGIESFDGLTPTFKLLARKLAADGTASAPQTLGRVEAGLAFLAGSASIAADGHGSATVGWYVGAAPDNLSFTTANYDAHPPTVDATIPATATVGEDVVFSARASDPSGVTGFAWEFGDGSGARGETVRHAYARPGAYPIELTVTDRSGDAAVVRRTLTVTAAATPPGSPQPPGLPQPPAREAPRAATGLKLTKALRSGAKVTVAGTISRHSGGHVTIAYRAKVGRKTVMKRGTARIVRGRFVATVRLPRALARSRARATVTVTYSGDADTRPATARRAVALARRAPARRGAARKR
ncbi:PKD domain-containing protein [Conexibacter woesei]|uniref:PKD domain containing protein n=1 Tax=Conexibacter woesei (strain DSM 14684 / CCUG 47730 / CIP 108061 / JCM 11494 / NBRC 100937 / ID131577) TaxID=469383 RepID=D3EYV3_CONWI|nr:PKD domain-containing protein [Conexibacter woesei]ADB49827.1 PKD domain containing protein [Conexibacter woesei DSM 14684]